ncbi:type VI secretion system baseplate subunit TssK [Photorhabdus temperata]|uniref:Type VI secretion protein, VC_A0114 family n=1 Tax=Photorhabdus temperata subsp. temperata Meg1 TaxID=1393735 RepID=A0A081RQQ8_PHOTE|nr:type VI secretion system baseplate subunit TssK [Photorhabdus temperata]KER01011.1 type VI secretion protein, VC_A0114 family [Photorhabdus temperata subsp. temperata Meg1]MCT8349859.1 type VI secretion system baseplate subunit TssK [Photorhabdus temperata]
MKIDRPLWVTGTILSPQQFQQQARWEAYTRECVARLGGLHPWGVLTAVFDKAMLALGQLKADHLCVRFADGSLIDTDQADRLPPVLELATVLSAETQQATVLLALPHLYANGGNCLKPDEQADRPVRYRQEWVPVQDEFSDRCESMAVARYAVSLRVDGMENSQYLTCPVARLVRDTQGNWAFDEQFIPPLLRLSANAGLMDRLDRLLTQLRAKQARLMGMRRESNERMADFAVADVSLFWLLNALNSYEPVLRDFRAHAEVHPALFYREAIGLAGSLLTFSLDHDAGGIPRYQHDNLTAVLPPLFDLLSELLEISLPSRMVAIELTKSAQQWTGTLHDTRLREAADFYLSVRSSVPTHQLQTRFPLLCKAGAPDEVNQMINRALTGIPLVALNQVPAAVPLRLENQYFALDLTHPSAKAMLEAGTCAFYVPSVLDGIQLELFAVLRT